MDGVTRLALLEIENLCVNYGMIKALRGVSFLAEEGEIVALLGANGAGKSTTLRAISGLVKPAAGDIKFAGKSLVGLSPHVIARLGISHVPEGRRVFTNLTVMENLELGAYGRKDRREVARDVERLFQVFPRLAQRRNQLAATLSGGEQQMLAIARALMNRGRLVLLDEPSMGLAPLLVQEIFRIILEINEAGSTVLLVEQNANMALGIADRAYVLEVGELVLEGTAEELRNNDRVRKAYLGG